MSTWDIIATTYRTNSGKHHFDICRSKHFFIIAHTHKHTRQWKKTSGLELTPYKAKSKMLCIMISICISLVHMVDVKSSSQQMTTTTTNNNKNHAHGKEKKPSYSWWSIFFDEWYEWGGAGPHENDASDVGVRFVQNVLTIDEVQILSDLEG